MRSDHMSGLSGCYTLRQVVRAADLGLTKKQIRALLAEADEDEDGMISYNEFIQGVAQLTKAFSAKQEAVHVSFTLACHVSLFHYILCNRFAKQEKMQLAKRPNGRCRTAYRAPKWNR